ncbi:MAG: hypothetical protein KatS3mg061_1951 [Dehalococcoidia bacterium]|nr:MAG: hypothetical protein KatS3mg061_1951 [Dehalococcoidia bacterium]
MRNSSGAMAAVAVAAILAVVVLAVVIITLFSQPRSTSVTPASPPVSATTPEAGRTATAPAGQPVVTPTAARTPAPATTPPLGSTGPTPGPTRTP